MYMNAYIFYIDYIVYIYTQISVNFIDGLPHVPLSRTSLLFIANFFAKAIGFSSLRQYAVCMALGCADCVGHKTRKYQKNTAINTVDTQHAADLFAFFYYLFYYVFIFIVFFCCSTFISLPLSVSLTLSLFLFLVPEIVSIALQTIAQRTEADRNRQVTARRTTKCI